jgi:beta-phosphoglucomutase-like phosphatase (HAD superfamily)
MTSTYFFRAVVFDMDGTLVNSAGIKTWAFGQLYKEYGQEVVAAVVSSHLKLRGVSRFEKFKLWQEDIMGEPYTDTTGEDLSVRFNHLVVDEIVQAPYIEGAEEFLEKHYKKLPLFLASATPEVELLEIVSRRGMKKYFQRVFGAPATKAEILKTIAVENRWNPWEMLMVGDAVSDYEGAKLAGADFVAICEDESQVFLDNVEIRLPDLTGLERFVYEQN